MKESGYLKNSLLIVISNEKLFFPLVFGNLLGNLLKYHSKLVIANPDLKNMTVIG